MSDFFRKLGEKVGKAARDIDKIAKETSQTPPEEQTTPSKGHNLRKILPVAEVARVTKLPFDTINDHFDDTWEGVVYTCSDSKIQTYFQACFARKDPESHDASGIWNYLTEVMPNPKPVKGIGDEAYQSDNDLFVRTGQDVLQAGGGLPLSILMQLAKIILEKVASL